MTIIITALIITGIIIGTGLILWALFRSLNHLCCDLFPVHIHQWEYRNPADRTCMFCGKRQNDFDPGGWEDIR